jgi:RNA polymerase sigma factor (sigma-70 family)
MRNLSDTDIIDSILKGNAVDFNLLIDKYKHRAFSMLKRMLKNQMDAEEVLQDSFLKAYYGLKNFRKESKFSTWFYSIVYHSALSRLSSKKEKYQKQMESIEDNFEVESLKTDFETNDYSNLHDMISKLPAKYASAVNLFYLEEMSCEEIAEIMKISVPNVKVLLHRSRNYLREISKGKGV